jgi:DNA-binding NarL/FixJ family response regulator
MSVKVAIYEDNDLLRETLSYLIRGNESMELTGAFPDPCGIIENCTKNRPDVILMDIDMPKMSGIEATALVKNTFPGINILILTIFKDKDKVFDALCAGATGYLLKKSSSVQIIEAIQELDRGGSPMTGEIARKVMEFFITSPVGKGNDYELSGREAEILKYLVNGHSYKMIADACCISISTVQFHIKGIYKKLHVNSKSEAIIKTLRERLIG